MKIVVARTVRKYTNNGHKCLLNNNDDVAEDNGSDG